MALHHRRELQDIRYAYTHDRPNSPMSSTSHHDRYSSASENSYQTAPSEYSPRPSNFPPATPKVHHWQSDMPQRYFYEKQPEASPAASVETYASTVTSDGGEDASLEDDPPAAYLVPDYSPSHFDRSNAIPATPSDFSELFPSCRSLAIRHDDSTIDGNMNLRVDIQVASRGQPCNVTLFHLRMHDLKNREFSLRRYCRDSGREVCRSRNQIPRKRPGLQRSISNALHNIRPKSESKTSTLANLARHDSGYGSTHSVDFNDADRPRSSGHDAQAPPVSSPSTIKLEFSNYAQVEIKRTGVKANKRYEFAYWGTTYCWKCMARKDGEGAQGLSHHLVRSGSDHTLAHVEPGTLTSQQAREERRKGGWIPPSSLRIVDRSVVDSKDLSEQVYDTFETYIDAWLTFQQRCGCDGADRTR